MKVFLSFSNGGTLSLSLFSVISCQWCRRVPNGAPHEAAYVAACVCVYNCYVCECVVSVLYVYGVNRDSEGKRL